MRVLFGLTACLPGTLWWFVGCVTKEVYSAKFIGNLGSIPVLLLTSFVTLSTSLYLTGGLIFHICQTIWILRPLSALIFWGEGVCEMSLCRTEKLP